MPLRNTPPSSPLRREGLRALSGASLMALGVVALSGCALMPGAMRPPSVHVVGIERVAGEALEQRFALKLRIQNPNPEPLDFGGMTVELDVNQRPLATGVSADFGSVPRLGEALVTVVVSVSASNVVRQMIGLSDGLPRGELPYQLRGRFTGGRIARVLGIEPTFATEGALRLPR